MENDSIVFSEAPKPPASVKYAEITVQQLPQSIFTFTNISGIFPNVGDTIQGIVSSARATATKVEGSNIQGFMTEGTFQVGELITGNATGFNGDFATISSVTNNGLFAFGETISNLDGNTAKVEEINLEVVSKNL